jgi:hypothetical protein
VAPARGEFNPTSVRPRFDRVAPPVGGGLSAPETVDIVGLPGGGLEPWTPMAGLEISADLRGLEISCTSPKLVMRSRIKMSKMSKIHADKALATLPERIE